MFSFSTSNSSYILIHSELQEDEVLILKKFLDSCISHLEVSLGASLLFPLSSTAKKGGNIQFRLR